MMLQIQDTVVSLDLIEDFFCCDIEQCLGQCCIEGDAGAPVSEDELKQIEEATPLVWNDLTPAGQRVLQEQGAAYYDEEGDLVTSIVEGRDCAFCTYAPGGLCLCALEKAWREGRSKFCKPASCHLYPARLKQFGSITAVNYHRWDICKSARTLGKAKGIRVYEFLKEPLIRHFGKEWYEELDRTAREYLSQKNASE